MASGIARSKFIRPMADALGWQLGRLRALFQRADYHAPYTDLQRALRIIQAHLPDQLPAVLKSLNLDATYLHADKPSDPASHQLALMPPASQAPATPNVPAVLPVKGLVDQLAHMIPGDDALADKRDKVRSILKKHGADGRMKDKTLAIAWLKKVFPGAEEHAVATVVEVAPDIETLPAERLRPLIRSLMAELADRDQLLKRIEKRFGDVKYFLDATKQKMVGDTGLFDVSEEQALFFLAVAAAKKPLQ
jgi:hypothetical protein